jgi:hypothetical protein
LKEAREEKKVNRRFELVVTLLTLASVALAIILYIPELKLSKNQQTAIYIFDLGLIGLVAYDFYARMRS